MPFERYGALGRVAGRRRYAPACLALWLAAALALPAWAGEPATADAKPANAAAPAGRPASSAAAVDQARASGLQFAGTASGEDGRVVYFLTDGNELLSVSEGDLVRGEFRVDGMTDGESLGLTHLKSHKKILLAPHLGPDPASKAGKTAGTAPASADEDAGLPVRRRPKHDD